MAGSLVHFTPKADMLRVSIDVCLVPQAEIAAGESRHAADMAYRNTSR